MSLSVGRYQSFLVRILSQDGEVVQGQITHVGTHESIRFREAQRMVDFILDHLRELPDSTSAESRHGGLE